MIQHNCDIKLLKLDKTIIPNIPFLWYREEQLLCPFNEITKENDIYTINQRHVIKDVNIYVCLHSLMYYTIHKNDIKEEITNISPRFNRQIIFKIKINLIEGEIHGIKLNEFVPGSVFIHGSAFSPPGCFCFKIKSEIEKVIFTCNVECEQLNIKEEYKFILNNETKENKLDAVKLDAVKIDAVKIDDVKIADK